MQPTPRSKWPLGPGSDVPSVGASDRVYETTKLGAVFDALLGQGASADDVLRDAKIPLADVHSPQAWISLAQLMTGLQENALRLSTDHHLPYRIGASIHISTTTACYWLCAALQLSGLP